MGSQRMAEVIDKRVMLDLDLCIECRSCSAACYYAHTDLPIVQYAELPVGKLPVICRQCEEAACVAVCPGRAIDVKGNTLAQFEAMVDGIAAQLPVSGGSE